jgi:hypothetical protein
MPDKIYLRLVKQKRSSQREYGIMRCTSCGLPLSPQRTHCPRCGKAAGEPAKQEEQPNVPQFAFSLPQENNTVLPDAETVQGQPLFATPPQAGNQTPGQIFYAAGTEEFPHQLSPEQDKTLLSAPDQSTNWRSASQPNQRSSAPATINPGEFQPIPHLQRPQAHSNRKVQPGFTIAGLCVLSGGIILMLVYIISLNLPPLSATNQSTSTIVPQSTSSNGAQGALPTNITLTPSLPTATPTPDFPGKAYIDNAQMASNIDYNTASPSLITTTFKVHEKIFVTFMLHPATSGAVCLVWYINQKQFSQFPFAVNAVPQHAFSYAYASIPGQGSVNIYWASSTACSDTLLAETVDFTVTP